MLNALETVSSVQTRKNAVTRLLFIGSCVLCRFIMCFKVSMMRYFKWGFRESILIITFRDYLNLEVFTFLIDRFYNFGNVLRLRFYISTGQILNEMVDSINLIVIILSGSLHRVAFLSLSSKRQDKKNEKKSYLRFFLRYLYEKFLVTIIDIRSFLYNI